MRKLFLIILICFTTSGIILAQKVKVVRGSLSCLKGQNEVNVTYKYDDLMVGKMTENAYVDRKYTEYEKREPGMGDRFKASWKSDRNRRYEPKFEELINKMVEGTNFGDFPDAPYTIIVHTKLIDPGFNVGVTRKAAFVNSEIKVVDKEDNEKAFVTVFRAPGSLAIGMDFDAGVRISEAYAVTGKRLGALIRKIK